MNAFYLWPVIILMTAESISWAISIIAQQKYIKTFKIKNRRAYESSIMLSIFSIISIILAVLIYAF